MNYTELVDAINATAEDAFETAHVDTFIKQAEILIYNAVQLPVQRQNQIGSMTTGNQYLTLPSGFLNAFSAAVLVSGEYQFMLHKDSNFIREAYPSASSQGVPKHYAQFDVDSLIVGPTPDDDYQLELHYSAYPESIVTASTTWLGDEFEPVLLNGALMQAARFQKSEEDVIKMYETLYTQSLTLLKGLSDGKMRQDAYRSGQARMRVK